MGKLTVYVPDQLSARLERIRSQGQDVNMSEVCRTALERAVATREATLNGDVAARVVERLKMSADRSATARHSGAAEGKRWAEDIASWSEIQAVVQWDVRKLQVTEIVDQDHEGATLAGMAITTKGEELAWPTGAGRPDEVLPKPDRFDPERCTEYVRGFQGAVDHIYAAVRPAME